MILKKKIYLNSMEENQELSYIQMIKIDIINTFGEDFYSVYIDNSDGISGLRSIKEKFTVFEIKNINKLSKNYKKLEFEEKYQNTPIFENIEKIFSYLDKLLLKIRSVEESSTSMKNNYEELEKIAIKRMNKKNGESLTKDEWLVKIPDLNETLKSLISKKWEIAYKKNYEESINLKYWQFEERMITNVFQTTIQYF